jgi:hypothetical protein
MKENLILKDFVEGLEMTLLNEEDAVLLEGMVGTSCPTKPNNCMCNGNNCQCGCNNCNCEF